MITKIEDIDSISKRISSLKIKFMLEESDSYINTVFILDE